MLSEEQMEFVEAVRRHWAAGDRQWEVAEKLGKSLSTVRSRLATYGLKFGRNGVLIEITPPRLRKRVA